MNISLISDQYLHHHQNRRRRHYHHRKKMSKQNMKLSATVEDWTIKREETESIVRRVQKISSMSNILCPMLIL